MHEPYKSKSALDRRIDEYWSWFAVALFLLLTVDMLTSVGAAVVHGLEAEINPLMRWVLSVDLVFTTAVHLLVLVLATMAFWGVMVMLERTPAAIERPYQLVIELWLGMLVAGGLFIFANNLAVIILGRSLV